MKLKVYLSFIFSCLCIQFVLGDVKQALVKEELIFVDPFRFCHASTIVETPTGDLLCAFIAGDCEGSNDVKVWMCRLPKVNRTWTPPAVVAKNNEVSCWNPVLFTTSQSEVLLFYKVGKNPREWTGCLKRSKNSGLQWSETEIFPAGVYGPVKNKPLEFDDKTLICGSSTESFKKWDCWMDFTEDFGKTWFKSRPIISGVQTWGIIQPALFYTKDNKLMLLARSKDRRKIMQSVSEDRGITWTNAEPTILPNPNSAVDAINLKDQSILLVYNHSTANRYPLNIATSQDSGKQWALKGALESDKGEFSYPSVILASDGLIHITYTWNKSHIKHVVLDPSKL